MIGMFFCASFIKSSFSFTIAVRIGSLGYLALYHLRTTSTPIDVNPQIAGSKSPCATLDFTISRRSSCVSSLPMTIESVVSGQYPVQRFLPYSGNSN